MLPQLTKSEFKTFILIYAAHVDYSYIDSEIQYIKDHSSISDYKKMITLFEEHTDYHSLKIILEHKEKFYHSESEKQKLYKQITELFLIDGDYSRPEKTFLVFLERLANQTSES